MSPRALPCVVQVGFAGSRRLIDPPPEDPAKREDLHRQVLEFLGRQLDSLPRELGLGQHHFLCGISQIAIGADTLFARACRDRGIPQRIFLPQHRDAYLGAAGSRGPDFNDAERTEALTLLDSPHVIQERLVSDAPNRSGRFEDCNREIFRVSDVVVCLVGSVSGNGRGGTVDLLELAKARGKPALEIQVTWDGDRLAFASRWHSRESFVAPALPQALKDVAAPEAAGPGALLSVQEFAAAVKQLGSEWARVYAQLFAASAVAVIGTHILATLCATLVLAGHIGVGEEQSGGIAHTAGRWLPIPVAALLIAEIALLAVGFLAHQWLHAGRLDLIGPLLHRLKPSLGRQFARPSGTWAISRLLAEINRSVRALGDHHLYLGYLFRLRLPSGLRPLLRTLNVLHLRSTRLSPARNWEQLRDEYVQVRLADPDWRRGQIEFFRHRCVTEKRSLRRARAAFAICTALAIAAAAMKLTAVACAPSSFSIFCDPRLLGLLAVFLPALAVGALSWAKAKDYEARVETFGEMRQVLEELKQRLDRATSAREFRDLVDETEFRLLGEVAEWYSRRTFPGAI